MSRYTLTRKIKSILEKRGYKLVCKICEIPLLVGDEIESKQQRRGKSKLYHSKCYDSSEYDIPDGENDDEELKTFFQIPIRCSMRCFYPFTVHRLRIDR